MLPKEQPKTVRMVLARGQRHCCLRRPAATIAVSLVVRFNLTMLRFHVPRDAQLMYKKRLRMIKDGAGVLQKGTLAAISLQVEVQCFSLSNPKLENPGEKKLVAMRRTPEKTF